ncbi:leucine-rich repeat-containing protein 74B isoform X2 [Protopterus annectens]|uniref:leucine-rich repeat-containing protein 74B isoform X2 n=1 Tax=Protopterus annectens TaxID=7888 RepID=UPI001CFA5BD9|nr:leucine-rich repeat-containing protein 74B isoform X2 [Protopterus annectens]
MVLTKKPSRDPTTLLPSVQEVKDAEQDMEERGADTSLEIGGSFTTRPPSRPLKAFSRGSIDPKTIVRPTSTYTAYQIEEVNQGPSAQAEEDEEIEAEPVKSDGSFDDVNASEEEWDTDLEMEDTKQSYDATGRTGYKEACKRYGVVPISYFLRHMQDSEFTMMHRGLGPQDAKALSVALISNTTILKLNLRDNWLQGEGGAAVAEMLKENCFITDVDLSENKLEKKGAMAIASMLLENTALVKVTLSGNEFDDNAAEYLAEAIMSNHKVESMDLSHNLLAERAGEVIGNAIAENTGMKELDLSWNCLRSKGAIALAKGLGANIFLRVLNLSYNGFGKEETAALGEALKVNNVLEELNISNNRISPEGAVRLAMGLRENKTLRILKMGRNPMQSAGCYGILKSVHDNSGSSLELLDFSDITVNKDFDELYNVVKETFSSLQVIHGGNADILKRRKPKANPLAKLKQHIVENNIRLVDFFEKVDEDKSTLITRSEFQQGLMNAGIPLSQDELQNLMDFLDKDKNGEIDFSELIHSLSA